MEYLYLMQYKYWTTCIEMWYLFLQEWNHVFFFFKYYTLSFHLFCLLPFFPLAFLHYMKFIFFKLSKTNPNTFVCFLMFNQNQMWLWNIFPTEIWYIIRFLKKIDLSIKSLMQESVKLKVWSHEYVDNWFLILDHDPN